MTWAAVSEGGLRFRRTALYTEAGLSVAGPLQSRCNACPGPDVSRRHFSGVNVRASGRLRNRRGPLDGKGAIRRLTGQGQAWRLQSAGGIK